MRVELPGHTICLHSSFVHQRTRSELFQCKFLLSSRPNITGYLIHISALHNKCDEVNYLRTACSLVIRLYFDEVNYLRTACSLIIWFKFDIFTELFILYVRVAASAETQKGIIARIYIIISLYGHLYCSDKCQIPLPVPITYFSSPGLCPRRAYVVTQPLACVRVDNRVSTKFKFSKVFIVFF